MNEHPREDDDPCPDPADLLLAHEGELPPPHWRRVLSHLRRCDPCRTRIERVDTILQDCEFHVARQNAETDINLRAFQQQLHRKKQASIHKHPMGAALRRWIPAVASVSLIALALILSWPQIQVVRAEGLLQQAATQERQRTASGLAQRMPLPPTHVAGRNIAALFDRQHLDSHQLVSIVNFITWRDSPPHKDARVSWSDDGAWLIFRATVADITTLRSGDLSQMEVAVRGDSLDIARQTLVFAEVGRVQIDAEATWVRREVLDAERAATAAAARALDRDLPGAAHLDGDDLDLALDLADLDRAAIDVRTIAMTRGASLAHPLAPALAEHLDRRLGRKTTARAAYVPGLIEHLAKVRAHFTALQALAERYPAVDARGARSRDVTRKLDTLLRRHYSQLSASLDIVDEKLTIIQGARPRAGSTPLYRSAHRRRRAAAGARAADLLDRQVRALLTHSERGWSDTTSDSAPEVATAFTAVWDTLYAPAPSMALTTTSQAPSRR
jgi:hypothetical protein